MLESSRWEEEAVTEHFCRTISGQRVEGSESPMLPLVVILNLIVTRTPTITFLFLHSFLKGPQPGTAPG